MDKKYVLVVVVLVLVVGGGYYYLQGGTTQGKNATEVLLDAVVAAEEVNTYLLESKTSIDGSEPIEATVIASGTRARVDILDATMVPRSFYFLKEGNFICLPERKTCMNASMNDSDISIKRMVAYAQSQIVVTDSENVERWVDSGVIEVQEYISERTVAERLCDEIKYAVRFDLMSSEDLARSGYTVGEAPFVDRKVIECLDKEAGFVLYRQLNSSVFGELRVLEFNVTRFEPFAEIQESEFALAGEIVGEEEFLGIQEEEIDKKGCMIYEDIERQNECLEEKAFNKKNPGYCEAITDAASRDSCYMIFVPLSKDPGLCEKMEILEDDCYYELGLGLRDATLCEKISDAHRAQLCETILLEDAEACKEIVLADECALNLAIITNDSAVCGQIGNENVREACLGNFDGEEDSEES
ncbi:hypothetical protein DRN67_04305 [Candidatus Micrarchaeota archaeon]|nr:MAG: hypothetical protein DRN67_04305 [Candidatus Micrarchaeota archaeon]